MVNVIISATSGAAQIVLLPNIIGIQNMAIAFITIPLHMAMMSDCFVLFVE